MLPATLLMGGVFPLTVRVATGGLDSVGHDVGNAYALNTVGAIVGSFLSGFIVLPRLGLEKGIYVAVLFDLALAAMLFWVGARAVAPPPRRRASPPPSRWRCSGLVIPRWDLGSFSSGFFRVSIAREYIYRKIHKRDWKTPEAGVLRGRHGHHRQRRSAGTRSIR